jgi:hypothetical protein
VDEEGDRLVDADLFRPADDEFFGVVVEVLLVERCRVDRVEELRNVADAHLDDLAARQDLVARPLFRARYGRHDPAILTGPPRHAPTPANRPSRIRQLVEISTP